VESVPTKDLRTETDYGHARFSPTQICSFQLQDAKIIPQGIVARQAPRRKPTKTQRTPKSARKKKIQNAEQAEYVENWNTSAYFAYFAVLSPFYFGDVFESQHSAPSCRGQPPLGKDSGEELAAEELDLHSCGNSST